MIARETKHCIYDKNLDEADGTPIPRLRENDPSPFSAARPFRARARPPRRSGSASGRFSPAAASAARRCFSSTHCPSSARTFFSPVTAASFGYISAAICATLMPLREHLPNPNGRFLPSPVLRLRLAFLAAEAPLDAAVPREREPFAAHLAQPDFHLAELAREAVPQIAQVGVERKEIVPFGRAEHIEGDSLQMQRDDGVDELLDVLQIRCLEALGADGERTRLRKQADRAVVDGRQVEQVDVAPAVRSMSRTAFSSKKHRSTARKSAVVISLSNDNSSVARYSPSSSSSQAMKTYS